MKITYDLDLTLHLDGYDVETLQDMAQTFQMILVSDEGHIPRIVGEMRKKYSASFIQENYTVKFNDIMGGIDFLYGVSEKSDMEDMPQIIDHLRKKQYEENGSE